MGVPGRLAERMSMAEQHEYLRSTFSRRSMIRGGAVTLGAVAGGVFVPAAARAATPAALRTSVQTRAVAGAERVDGSFVAPFGRHLAHGNDPRTEITVSWQVPLPVKKPFVRVGTHASHLSVKIDAEVRTLHAPAGVGASGDHTRYYMHAEPTHPEARAEGALGHAAVRGIAETGAQVDQFTVARRAGWCRGAPGRRGARTVRCRAGVLPRVRCA
jgi:hypothetical protein